ncbi:YhcB family protein [Salinibius halmophilus]|uniref:YhcB family protein n=1 Tax=Salinibius halmophilus TaxID=1853216 RepID=UPI000E670C65|nr:DUF1043 family protein [Salinibius halmophilus]
MELSTLILGTAVGAIIGALVTWLALRNTSQTELQKKYEALKATHETYQVQVNNHFQHTSELIESLNERYQAVNLHIAKGIDELTQPDALVNQTRDQEGQIADQSKQDEPEIEPPSAPRDYAEKH